jgi:hypothetical protein
MFTLDTLMRIKLLGPASVDDDAVSQTASNLNDIALQWLGLRNRVPQRSSAGISHTTREPKHSFGDEFKDEELGQS